MSTEYAVTVSDEVDEALNQFDDERIREELVEALQHLATVSDKQDELRERSPDRSTQSDESDGSEVSAEMQREQLREFLRGTRTNGVDK